MSWITSVLCACAVVAFLAAGCSRAAPPEAPLVTKADEPLPPIETVTIGPNNEFLVNGRAFLPIMSWAQDPKNFKMLRGQGINTFCGNQSDVSAKMQCDAAREAGGYGVPGFREKAEEAIGHAHLLAWIHGDEPDMPRKQDDGSFKPKRSVDEVAAKYREIKSRDTARPVFVTFTTQFMSQKRGKYDEAVQKKLYPAFAASCDVAGFDEYPIYGSSHPNHLNWPAYAVDQLREIAGPKRPIYVWIETHKGSKWMTYERQLDVLPKHTRFEVWGVLIRGATAVGYFTHAWRPSFTEFAPTADMQAELKRLNGQITRLAPAILADPAKTEIRMALAVKPQGVTSDQAAALECHFKATDHDGSLWIFAQNMDLGPGAEKLKQFEQISPRGGTATITIAGLKAGTTIEVVDEGRTIAARDGSFSDAFGPLAEHIYRVGK